ncbi:MAG: T9SS type A sorting domain-containing protein, partial [Bacteroidales bacterium]|nr:T9SS type A sorting domain-containing protein [Bacteroidales bacterium]
QVSFGFGKGKYFEAYENGRILRPNYNSNGECIPYSYTVRFQFAPEKYIDDEIQIYVYKRKLEIDYVNINHYKIYDGDNRIKPNAPIYYSNIVDDPGVSELIPGKVEAYLKLVDNVRYAFFDDPEIGVDKTIFLNFEPLISNTALDRYYIQADDITYHDGVITGKNLDVDNYSAPSSLCPNDEIVFGFDRKSGIPAKVVITFNDDARLLGLDRTYEIDLDPNIVEKHYEVSIPSDSVTTYGTISGKLQVFDNQDHFVDPSHFSFGMNVPESYLHAKYEDVILVDNHEFLFVGYQWYKNGELIEGATKQYYVDPGFLKGWYSCDVITIDNERLSICPQYHDHTLSVKDPKEGSVLVYPNPATSSDIVTISLEEFADLAFDGSEIFIYNSLGTLVQKIKNVDKLNTVQLPSGNYSGFVIIANKKQSFKFIVRD